MVVNWKVNAAVERGVQRLTMSPPLQFLVVQAVNTTNGKPLPMYFNAAV
jgi:hypothetical protein